jgi:hypothetical protein
MEGLLQVGGLGDLRAAIEPWLSKESCDGNGSAIAASSAVGTIYGFALS